MHDIIGVHHKAYVLLYDFMKWFLNTVVIDAVSVSVTHSHADVMHYGWMTLLYISTNILKYAYSIQSLKKKKIKKAMHNFFIICFT